MSAPTKRRSLRLRLGLIAGLTILAALSLAGAGLVLLFERHVERRLGAELNTYLDQLAAGLAFEAGGALAADARLADPRFDKVYGGLYWQIRDESDGARRRSRSLWDMALALPQDAPPIGVIASHRLEGPRGAPLLVHERRLILAAPEGERVIRIAVAVARAEVDGLIRDFAFEVGAALTLLGALLTAAAAAQLWLGLRPLSAVREDLAAMRSGAARRLGDAAPSEIGPLVDEMNALLAAQQASIAAARAHAADLAHGFNTPLTSLMADARRLRDRGETALAGEIEATARAMRRQIERELARVRGGARRGPAGPTDPGPILEAVLRTLRRTPAGERAAIEIDRAPGARAPVAIDPEDLAEILGNLLENAVRHARARIRISLRAAGERIEFRIEDDGPGVPPERRAAVADRGVRLDQSGGAGLGLAIVSDILARYGGALVLEEASLGGLAARFALPAAPSLRSRARDG